MPKNSPAKTRALRIQLNSFSSDRLAKWRNIFTITAVSIAVAWLLVGLFEKKQGADRFSPGPVSRAHAHLNCESCHGDGEPLRDATFLSAWKKDRESNSELWHRTTDLMCQKCHPVTTNSREAELPKNIVSTDTPLIGEPIAVSPHSPYQLIQTVDSCASCHHEHRGFEISPTDVSDASCIRCHQRLDDFRMKENHGIVASITRFDRDHPEFRSLKKDRGVLKFSHTFHMSPGLKRVDEQASLVKTLADYPNQNGQLAGFTNAAGEIQLQCNFCHNPSREPKVGTLVAASSAASNSSGQFMSMPSFDQNCQICHSIDLMPAPKHGFVSELKIQHGASPEKIISDLKVYFSLAAIAPAEMKAELVDVVSTLPALPPTKLWNMDPADESVPKWVRDDFLKAANIVQGSCWHCHFKSTSKSGLAISGVRTMDEAKKGAPEAGRSSVTDTVWFKHAKFDHAAHRDVSCVKCHEMNGGKNELGDAEIDKPMIADLASCIECHQPASKVFLPDRPGPFDCHACHTYHGGGNR